MITYKTLENTSFDTLYKTFDLAFSDYIIRIPINLEDFKAMILSRDYHANLSMGAFENDRLIGFVLTGFRIEENRQFAYNISTGVIPSKRQLGIAKEVMMHTIELLRNQNIDAWFLEVIQENRKAVRLYESLGFKHTRDLVSFKRELMEFNVDERTEYNKFLDVEPDQYWDFTPAWQNIVSTYAKEHGSYSFFGIEMNQDLAGYAIFNPDTGSILQFAVNKEYRNQKLGTQLLDDICNRMNAPYVSFVNIPSDSAFATFLKERGFYETIKQFEMILTLKQ